MSDAKAAKADKAKPQKKSGGGFKVIFFMTILGCLAPFGLPTLLVCLGFMPTLVALFTDTDGRGSGVAAVGYMNLAGVLPFLVDLWQKGQTMDVAMTIMRDPFTWVVMLGAAGVGHLILFSVPAAVVTFVYNRQQARLRTLREAVKELEAIWGPEVANVVPVDTVLHNRGVD
jgi:hypothetical protein